MGPEHKFQGQAINSLKKFTPGNHCKCNIVTFPLHKDFPDYSPTSLGFKDSKAN
jgi:hypothetical protein